MNDFIILILIYGCLIVGFAAQLVGWIYDRREVFADRGRRAWMWLRLLWTWFCYRYFVGHQRPYDEAVAAILAAYYGESEDEEQDADEPLPPVSNAAETGDDTTLPASEEMPDEEPETGGGEAWQRNATVLATLRDEAGKYLLSQNQIRDLVGKRMVDVAAIVGPLRAAQSGAGDEAQPAAAPHKHSFTREELGLGKGMRR